MTSRSARAPWPCRAGVTLIEMVVALSIAGITLALVGAITVREQRVFADLADRAATVGQLREAAAILPIELRALSPASGDIRTAADTALELRGTIGSGVVCDTAPGALVLPPTSAGVPYASFVMAPDAGDTAWLLAASDSGDRWDPHAVTGAAAASPGRCVSGGPAMDALGAARPRTRLSLAGGTTGVVAGTPVRITRALRYSVYRASDGGWYLGERDWNAAQMRFTTIQPVAGPFLAAASGGGVRFRYLDSAGMVLAAPVAPATAVRSIEIGLQAQTRRPIRILGATRTARVDSARVVVALRNR